MLLKPCITVDRLYITKGPLTHAYILLSFNRDGYDICEPPRPSPQSRCILGDSCQLSVYICIWELHGINKG